MLMHVHDPYVHVGETCALSVVAASAITLCLDPRLHPKGTVRCDAVLAGHMLFSQSSCNVQVIGLYGG